MLPGFRRWRVALLMAGSGLVSCVQAGEIPYLPVPEDIEILPDSATDWVDHSGGPTDGWHLKVPAGAVDEAVYIRLATVAVTADPVVAQGWELAFPAVQITPQEIAFVKPAELVIPGHPPVAKLQVLYAPDATHIAAEIWEYTEAVTSTDEVRISLPLTSSFWPVVSRTVGVALTVTEPVICVDPFVEEKLDAAMELPEAEGECSTVDGCQVSGCQNEICAPGIRASTCVPPPRVCAGGCGCIAGVCRWLQ